MKFIKTLAIVGLSLFSFFSQAKVPGQIQIRSELASPIVLENSQDKNYLKISLTGHGQSDFIILDIMMPELDGYSVCREIRKLNDDVPILFLSAKDEEIDRVVGLELGADDFMSKPFGVHELRARIKAIAKRYLKSQGTNKSADEFFNFGDLTVYPIELCAKRNDQVIELSLREVKILECLYQNKNQVVTRDMLFDYVWGYDYSPNSRTLDQHISKLRKQIEIDPLNPVLIKTIHGVGYRY